MRIMRILRIMRGEGVEAYERASLGVRYMRRIEWVGIMMGIVPGHGS